MSVVVSKKLNYSYKFLAAQKGVAMVVSGRGPQLHLIYQVVSLLEKMFVY